MNAAVTVAGNTFLLHAERGGSLITSAHFDPAWWRARGAETGTASGRGPVSFVRAPDDGGTWVLRHYLRGGWVARWSRDRYLWTGLARTRAWREWHLTARLQASGLPVPYPIAARVIRHGWTYTADLITRCIDNADTLARVLGERALRPVDWQRLGATLRRFHVAGVRHDDINVSNILLHADGNFHVIDFDRAVLTAPGGWQERNLARFKRSLEKQRKRGPGFSFSETDWKNLRQAYDRPASGLAGP